MSRKDRLKEIALKEYGDAIDMFWFTVNMWIFASYEDDNLTYEEKETINKLVVNLLKDEK